MLKQYKMKHKHKNKRRLLMVLPIMILPLITLLFWAMGGGQEPGEGQTTVQHGLNTELPKVNTDKGNLMDKMSYYEKAAKDSAKWEELTKNDPYYKPVLNDDTRKITPIEITITDEDGQDQGSLMNSPYGDYQDPNEKKVYQKLEELEAVLNSSGEKKPEPQIPMEAGVSPSDIDRLEMMMHQMTSSDPEDPELRQLDGMLQTIMDIQHPERVQQRLREASRQNKGQVYGVTTGFKQTPVTFLDGDALPRIYDNGFYGLEEFPRERPAQNAIAAVIHQTQSVVAGATIKLRLLQDVYIEGMRIPKGHFVYGIATLNGERLDVTIDGIRYENSLFPVELVVYSTDGIKGLHIPGALSRKVAKESAAGAVQGVGLSSFDTSLGAQMAGAGIEATRSLLSKRAKLIKVTIKAGDRVLLKDEKQKNY